MREEELFLGYGIPIDEPDPSLAEEAIPLAASGYPVASEALSGDPVRVSTAFWTHVRRLPGEHSCWLWTGARNLAGYGQVVIDGKTVLAHRYAYQEEHGPIPDGVVIRHRCVARRNCVRPAHLVAGDQAANMRDMREQRQRGVWQSGSTVRQREFAARRRAAVASAIPHVVSDLSTDSPPPSEHDATLLSTAASLHGDDEDYLERTTRSTTVEEVRPR